MRPVTYGGSVSGQVRDPLEWFRFGSPGPLSNSAMPDLGLGAVGFVRGRVLLGQTLPFSSYWPIGPGCQRTLLGALNDRWATWTGDLIPDKPKEGDHINIVCLC